MKIVYRQIRYNLFRSQSLGWALIAFLLVSCARGTEVGNGRNEEVPTENDNGEAPMDKGSGEELSPGTDAEAPDMIETLWQHFLFANCGSPFAEAGTQNYYKGSELAFNSARLTATNVEIVLDDLNYLITHGDVNANDFSIQSNPVYSELSTKATCSVVVSDPEASDGTRSSRLTVTIDSFQSEVAWVKDTSTDVLTNISLSIKDLDTEELTTVVLTSSPAD